MRVEPANVTRVNISHLIILVVRRNEFVVFACDWIRFDSSTII
jgi:DNA primase large subunit